MPAPSNDNFASAQVLSGQYSNGAYTNAAATTQTGEPGHYVANPVSGGPTPAIVGPYATVWFAWVCGTTAGAVFGVYDSYALTAQAMTINVFTGTAVNGLTRVTPVVDQSVGNGPGGSYPGATFAFNAVSGTTYYIQVDSRVASLAGNFTIWWDSALSADDFTNAQAISGASGLLTYPSRFHNFFATVETGEPPYYQYNRGPSYPTGSRNQIGPFATLWFSWTCPASGNYYFSTRATEGQHHTNFGTMLNIYTGTAVNALTRVTPLLDLSAGANYGADDGATFAFAATSGTTYYLQVGSRNNTSFGYFIISWNTFVGLPRLGGCTSVSPDFTVEGCVGQLFIADITTNGFYSFGSIAAAAGIFAVKLSAGNPIGDYISTLGTPTPCAAVVDGNASGFTLWSDLPDSTWTADSPQPAYSSGAVVYCPSQAAFAIAVANVPACAPGSYLGPTYGDGVYWTINNAPGSGTLFGTSYSSYDPNTSYSVGEYMGTSPTFVICATACAAHAPYGNACTQNGGSYWNCLPVFTNPTAECALTLLRHHTITADIGIAVLGNSISTNGANPTYELIYYPLTMSVLSNPLGVNTGSSSSLQNVGGFGSSGHVWECYFNITNSAAIDWDETTVTLLTGGGITSPSTPVVVDLAAGASTPVGMFTFTAHPELQLVTATIQISRNGIVVGELVYPLYPIFAVTLSANNQEETCTIGVGGTYSGKLWRSTFNIAVVWPATAGDFENFGYGGFNCTSTSVSTINQVIFTASAVSLSVYPYDLPGGPTYNALCCTPAASCQEYQCESYYAQTLNIDLPAGSSTYSATLQLAMQFQTSASAILTLPTFSQTITVPVA